MDEVSVVWGEKKEVTDVPQGTQKTDTGIRPLSRSKRERGGIQKIGGKG